MPRRLRLPYIERKPKEVLFAEPLSVVVKLTTKQEDFFDRIIDAIVDGKELPWGAYRVSNDVDALLEQRGVMHLHLEHPGSSELIFLIQYDDHVTIIEIGDHRRFGDVPVGLQLQPHEKLVQTIEVTRRYKAFMEAQQSQPKK